MRRETESAIRAATIAQQIADSRDGADRVTSKGGIDIVTAADLACEDAIRRVLADAFPEYPVIGEERAGHAIAGRPYWLVDPICGTRAFASNVPLYCTNIALVENGAVTVAAIGMGRTGELLFSERGMGAWMRTSQGDQRVHAGTTSNTLWIDGETEHAANVVRRALLMDQWYVWLFSSSVFYAHLAAGRISGIIHFGTESSIHGSVHTAAGCFMASEAGAVVTDLDSGGPWSLRTQSYLLAATPELHRELSELVGREGKGT
jgi:myo-inositol-1(or 4)-monophosphatase